MVSKSNEELQSMGFDVYDWSTKEHGNLEKHQQLDCIVSVTSNMCQTYIFDTIGQRKDDPGASALLVGTAIGAGKRVIIIGDRADWVTKPFPPEHIAVPKWLCNMMRAYPNLHMCTSWEEAKKLLNS